VALPWAKRKDLFGPLWAPCLKRRKPCFIKLVFCANVREFFYLCRLIASRFAAVSLCLLMPPSVATAKPFKRRAHLIVTSTCLYPLLTHVVGKGKRRATACFDKSVTGVVFKTLWELSSAHAIARSLCGWFGAFCYQGAGNLLKRGAVFMKLEQQWVL
jgi:hypothetical protein